MTRGCHCLRVSADTPLTILRPQCPRSRPLTWLPVRACVCVRVCVHVSARQVHVRVSGFTAPGGLRWRCSPKFTAGEPET